MYIFLVFASFSRESASVEARNYCLCDLFFCEINKGKEKGFVHVFS